MYRSINDEHYPLGVFRVDQADVEDTGAGLVTTVTGYDRARTAAEARLETALVIAAGENVNDVIYDLVAAAIGAIDFVATPTTATTPLLVLDAQTDPWSEALRLAESIGHELYFDSLGRLVSAPEPTLGGDPTVTIAEGDGGILVSSGLRWSRDGVYNAVIATGDGSDGTAPAYGLARDLDPASPTYYFGAFGRKPRFYASELLLTDDQATAAAAGILQRSLGVPRSVRWTSVPDPTLRPSQVIRVQRSTLGINENHIIETLDIPLAPTEQMAGTTRTQFL